MPTAVWNSSDKSALINLSNGDLTATSASNGDRGARSDIGVSSGKYYWEVTVNTDGGGTIGIGVANSSASLDARIGTDTNSWGYLDSAQKRYNASSGTFGNTFTAADVIGVAIDMDAGKIWWSKNGVWQANELEDPGDPEAGTHEAYSGLSGTLYAFFTESKYNDAVTANFGATAFTYTAPSGFGTLSSFDEYEVESPDSLAVSDTVDAFGLTDSIPESVAIADTVDGFNLSDSVGESIVFQDQIDAGAEYLLSVSENVGIADLTDAMNLSDLIPESMSISDVATRIIEAWRAASDSLSLADSADAFNWSEFLRQYEEIAQRVYYCTLTGAADGTTDTTLPMESFQARIRTGEPTYLGVVIPTVEYAEEIDDRSNGDIVVYMAYIVDGVEQHREEIARGTLTSVRVDRGPRNQSITLTGYRTDTYSSKEVELVGVSYSRTSDGVTTYRTAYPDLYLRPGDTATYDGDSITVGMVTYFVSVSSQQMEVTEAS